MSYSGIDQHKLDSTIPPYHVLGERVGPRRLRNDRSAILKYFTPSPGPHRAVVESTGGWSWLRNLLAPTGVDLPLAHATRLKALSRATVKTDAIDSDTLAQLGQADLIPPAYMIRPEWRGARDLLRTRLRLVSKRTSCRNSVHRLLEKFNVADGTALPPIYQLQATCHHEQRDLLLAQIHRLEHELTTDVLRLPAVQRLLWIPGIGKLGSCTIALEVDDSTRFPSDRPFVSYYRLVPGADNSGGKTRPRSGAKVGNRYLTIAFTHAAIRAIQDHAEIKA